MSYINRSLMLIIVAMFGIACDTGSQSTSSADGRTRLSAQNSYAEFGDYVIHVNGMSSVSLTPEIATNYGITRSEDRGIINLVVLKKNAELGVDVPVVADIKLSTANLTAQFKDIVLKEIKDGPSIYYIGEVPVDDEEMLNFDFDIRPAGSKRVLLVRFSHQFYTR